MRRGAAARHRCATCGDWTHPPEGVFLVLVAKGRTICDGCGRFQVYCPCPRRPA